MTDDQPSTATDVHSAGATSPQVFVAPNTRPNTTGSDVRGPGPAHTTSLLDDILAELEAKAEVADVTLEVPLRPTFAVTFRPQMITEDRLADWKSRATIGNRAARRSGANLDVVQWLLSAVIISETCVAIRPLIDGATVGPVIPDPNSPSGVLEFRSTSLQRSLQPCEDGTPVTDAATAVRSFYGTDYWVVAVSEAIMRAAGWAENVEPMDPTSGP